MSRERIAEIMQKRVMVLDGATGTQLQLRGMPEGVCPELWCIENPGPIQDIHRAYRDAGSDVVYSCTFGGNRYKLEEYGESNVIGVNRKLVEIAREAVGENCLIAGDIAPTGKMIAPFGEVPFEEAVEIYKEQVRGLLEGGVDLFVIETMMDIQEARAALIAVRELSDAFCMVTMTYEESGRTLNGTDPITALVTLQALGADAVGCNCSTGPVDMLKVIKSMKPYATIPLVAKPNAGLPQLRDGKTVFDMGPAEFGSFADKFIAGGVGIMGGCCGTTPEHIGALSRELGSKEPVAPLIDSLSAVSSARQTLKIDKDGPVLIIGERINPTGKKDLQAELAEGKLSIVRKFAKEQEKRGANLLDVNVGMPNIDEKATSNKVVDFLSTISDLPLAIDSSDIDTIESSLRRYPGRALLNSISGEPGKLEALAPIAAKYGAMFILLPIKGRSVPKTAQERQQVVEELFNQARQYGITKDDIVVDALAMAVSADQSAARETLDTIRWCSEEFGVRTVLGLSNVSFGLPERRWVNAAFMAMNAASGLTMAIANPDSAELMAVKMASDVLCARDKDATNYIKFASTVSLTTTTAEASTAGAQKQAAETPAEKVMEAVIEGNRDDITAIIQAALDSGCSCTELVDDCMIPAIQKVGDLYDKKIYFLPQLIASAEAMKKGFELLEPMLAQGGQQSKGKILFATVQGDIHDIGKNIVCLMLKNNGFDVIDLGKDVKHADLLSAIEEHQPDIVGLSALMTTTMVNMEDAIKLAREHGQECPFMVGGAVVTRDYAKSIGAHYSKDGVEAVKVAEELIRR